MEPFDKKAKSVKACETCKKPFGITRIRHTCKRCHKIICADCTKGRIKIVTYDLKNAHKVCIACEKENNFQTKFAATYQTSWNTLSKLGARWLEICNPKIILSDFESQSEETYQGYLALANNSNLTNPIFQEIDADIAQGKADREGTNYSLQGFLYYNQGSLKPDQIRTSISNVLKAFFIKFPSISYSHSLNCLCMFLLSLMDEDSAFWTLGYIVTQILPKDFFGQNVSGGFSVGLQQEKFILNSLIKEKLELNQKLAAKVTMILDNNASALLSPLLVNSINFEVSFEAWNMMLLNKNMNEIRKVIIQIFKILLPKIQENPTMSLLEFKLMVVRSFNSEEFKESQNIVINEKEIELLEEKFRSEFSTAFETKTSDTSIEVPIFNQEQILALNEQFSKIHTGIIGKEDFEEIVAGIEGKELLHIDQLYNSFTANKDEGLDYIGFLFYVTMLSNTSLEKKIQTAFEICDQDHQGFLTKGQFDKYVQFLIQTSAKFNTSNYFHDDAEAFKETLSNLTSDKEGVFFNDVIGQLLNNDFAKYYTNLPNSGHIEPDHKTSHHQKELIADASLVNNNQTVMDSTHDVSHNLHSNLTRLLDHSNEQSTIQEAEGSKYEEDQSRTEELLTEEQKEKILGLDHEIGECHGYINSKNSIQEDHKEVTSESIEQMEPKIPLEKTQEDSESDSEEQMKAMMLKLKNSPKKAAQAPVSNEGFVVNKVENLINLDQVADNFISASKSDERCESLDNCFEKIFNFNKEGEVLKAHSLERTTKSVPLPFAKKTLLPLKATEVDIKPSYLDVNYFENTLKSLPRAHNSVPISINVKKLIIKTDLLQVLDADSQSHNVQTEGWKENCFETTQTSAMVSEIVNKCPIIQKPLINNPCFTPSPEQEQEQHEIPNLHFWRPDEIDHGDLPTKPSTIVAPSRIVQKCVPKLLDVTNKGLSPLQVLNPNDFQPSFENEFVTFNKTNIALKRNEMPCISAPMKRPIFDNSCASLLQEAPDKRDSSYALETRVFECFNAPAKENKFVETTAPLKNSFEKADFLAPLSKDFIKESTTLLWKENCFEMNDNKLIESNRACLIENNQPPFGKEICNPLSPVRKTSDAPVIEGWKEGCFNLTDKPALHCDICEADSGSKGLNKVEESLLSHHKAEISSSIIWNSEIFECINLPHKASPPSMRLSTGIKLLQKPELSDLNPSTSNKIDVQSELKIFGSINQPVLANNSVSLALKVPKIQKPVFENIAQSLKVDECDDQMIEMNFSFKDSYDQGRAESQECATTSKSVDKVEEYIDDGILTPLAQDKHEETSSSIRLNQLFGIFNKVEAPLQPASDTVSKNVEEELEKSFEEVKEECQWHEREQEIEFKPPEVMEGSALDEKKNRAEERSVVLEKNSTQAKEPAERTSLKTNAEDIDRKQLIYDEEDEESDVSSTLITSPTLGENTNVGIYNEIAENENDPQIQSKRKEDANKEAMSEQKSEACKTCNVF